MNNEELIDELVIHKNINRETIPENIFNERGYKTQFEICVQRLI